MTVYTLASANIDHANIDQSVPNLATIYMPIRSRMSSILGQIKPEQPQFFAIEFWKFVEDDIGYSLIIYKYWPISTKLGQNGCYHKTSDVWLWI